MFHFKTDYVYFLNVHYKKAKLWNANIGFLRTLEGHADNVKGQSEFF